MASWYESHIDRRIREAQEQGQFDNLPGAGKPLSDHGREYDEDWWVKEAQDLRDSIDRRTSEADVRAYVAGFNEQLRKARAGLLNGPPVLLPPIDVEKAVRGWRDRRAA